MAQLSGSTSTLNTVSLAGLGFQVIEAFKKVGIALKNKTDDRDWPTSSFLAEAERFELWAANLGLFVAGHGSLDYRVRDAENLSRTLGRFLEELINSLNDVVQICSGANQEQLLLGSDNDETDSSDEDDDDDDGDDESDIDLLLDGIRDPISRLFRVSTKIRNPSTRIGSSKAALFQKIDKDTGLDFLEVIRKEDYDYVRSVFLEHQKHRARQEHEPSAPPQETRTGDNQDEVWEPIRTVLLNEKKSPDSFLIGRIAQANTLRRRQFAYWAQHRDKLNQHTKTALSTKPAEGELGELSNLPAADLPKVGELPSQLVIEQGTTVPSVTTATNLNIARLEAMDDRSTWTVSEYAPSTWQPSRDAVEFPPAPKLSRKTPFNEFFECPYCFTLCSRETLAEKAWKAHLIHDLRPYICTYEHCNSATQMFDSRWDWIQHENAAHRKVYRCFQHSDQAFAQLDDYKRHLKKEHADFSDSEASLRRIVQASESVLDVVDRPCPICTVTLDTPRGMAGHIASHLERLAQFSFPRCTQDSDDWSNADSDKANGTVAGESRDDDFESVTFEEVDEGDDFDSTQLSRLGMPSANGLTEGAMQELNKAANTVHDITSQDAGNASEDTAVSIQVIAKHIFTVSSKVSDIDLSPNGKYLAFSQDAKNIQIINLSSQDFSSLIGHESDCWAVSWSSDGRIATGDFDGTIKLWSAESRQCLKTISAHKDTINDLTFSPDGQYLVSASWDGTSNLWTSNGEYMQMISEDYDKSSRSWISSEAVSRGIEGNVSRAVYVAGYTPDGNNVVTGSDDLLSIFGYKHVVRSVSNDLGLVSALAFTRSSKLLIAGSWKGLITLWDFSSGTLIRELDRTEMKVTSLAMSHSGLLMASATEGGVIKLWNTKDWTVIVQMEGHTHAVNTIVFSNDDRQLFSCSDDRTIRIWSLDLASRMGVPGHSDRTAQWAAGYSEQVA